jgi:hypothetical protein
MSLLLYGTVGRSGVNGMGGSRGVVRWRLNRRRVNIERPDIACN